MYWVVQKDTRAIYPCWRFKDGIRNGFTGVVLAEQEKIRKHFQIDRAGKGMSERRINMYIALGALSRCLTEKG